MRGGSGTCVRVCMNDVGQSCAVCPPVQRLAAQVWQGWIGSVRHTPINSTTATTTSGGQTTWEQENVFQLVPGLAGSRTSRGCERNSELDTDVLPCRPAADHAGLKMPGWQAGPYSKSGIHSEIQEAKNTTFGFIVVLVSEFACFEAEQRKQQKFVPILG